jgi:hypothetical protein
MSGPGPSGIRGAMSCAGNAGALLRMLVTIVSLPRLTVGRSARPAGRTNDVVPNPSGVIRDVNNSDGRDPIAQAIDDIDDVAELPRG